MGGSVLGEVEVSISGLVKSFGRTTVLHGIDLRIRPGEFIGLMGPNGAGKSTLLKILDGLYAADRGEIWINGERVGSFKGRSDVAFIHQDLGLLDSLSVVDNLRLGQPKLRLVGPILNERRERQAAERALLRVGLDVAPGTLVRDLSAGEKTLVAIARALDSGASLLFVDEATSTLPPAEARRVIDSLTKSAAEGASIVMVTHKLHEILDAGSRLVVLIDGRIAADVPRDQVDRASLVEMLADHEAAQDSAGDERAASPGEVLLDLSGARSTQAGPVDLQLRAGEIVGITGLPGSRLHEVAALIANLSRTVSGTRQESLRDSRRLRCAFIPPYRETQGGLTGLTVRENMTIASLRGLTRGGLVQLGRERQAVSDLVRTLNVKPTNPEGKYDSLSGGNKQKVLFGRVLMQQPDVYVLCEPTRGVDVGTRRDLYQLIRQMRDNGAAVVIASSDAEDLISMCDRIGVVEAGRLGRLAPLSELETTELEVIV